jgi:hypothetical protein
MELFQSWEFLAGLLSRVGNPGLKLATPSELNSNPFSALPYRRIPEAKRSSIHPFQTVA